MKSKTKALTPEEKLTQALLPREEWPYELPEGWVWTRLGNLTRIIGGGTPKTSVKEYYEEGNIPWISPADLSGYSDKYIQSGAKSITKLGLEKSSAVLMPANTVLLSSRAPIGYVAIASKPISTNQGFKNFLPSSAFLPEYLYWYLKGNIGLLEDYASGTTFLELSKSRAEQIPFPLVSLPEQQRIVDKIESLFSKLDEAKDHLQKVLDGYEARRAAILHEAFSGKWTGDHGAGDMSVPKGWRKVKFTDVAEVKSNLVSPEDYPDFPHIAPDNIEKMTGRLLSYNTVQEDGVKSPKHHFFPGQILYSKIRPYLSKVVTVNFEGLCSADMYPIEAKENARYLWYYMLSNEFLNQAVSGKSRTVLPKINRKELANIQVLIPGLSLQQFIVDKLDAQFKNERMAKEVIQKTLIQIDLMKKSILARAFRGELGTQDPSDPSALALLKECVMEGKEGSKS